MPDYIPTSSLPDAGPLDGSELVPLSQMAQPAGSRQRKAALDVLLARIAQLTGLVFAHAIEVPAGATGNQVANLAQVLAAIQTATTNLWDDRGNYDASSNVFPSAGGSGTAGAVLKGDIWNVNVAGTLGGVVVAVNDTVRALVDSPGQTASNWAIAPNKFTGVTTTLEVLTDYVLGSDGSATRKVRTLTFTNGLVTAISSETTTTPAGISGNTTTPTC